MLMQKYQLLNWNSNQVAEDWQAQQMHHPQSLLSCCYWGKVHWPSDLNTWGQTFVMELYLRFNISRFPCSINVFSSITVIKLWSKSRSVHWTNGVNTSLRMHATELPSKFLCNRLVIAVNALVSIINTLLFAKFKFCRESRPANVLSSMTDMWSTPDSVQCISIIHTTPSTWWEKPQTEYCPKQKAVSGSAKTQSFIWTLQKCVWVLFLDNQLEIDGGEV